MFKKKPKFELVVAQNIIPKFTTMDGKEHESGYYHWIDAEQINIPAPAFIMRSVVNEGYLTGDDDLMYPLSNIVSINWIIREERRLARPASKYPSTYYRESEIEKMAPWVEEDGKVTNEQ
jgi:hypothetical protein